MNEISTSSPPPPKLAAVSHNGAGCFSPIIVISVLVAGFAFMSDVGFQAILLLCGIAGLCGYLALPAWRRRRHFKQKSIVTEGAITRLWYVIVEDGEGGKSTHYYFAYIFPGGEETRQEITEQRSLFAKPGDPVTVRYLLEQPQRSQVDWELMQREKLASMTKV